MLTENIVISIKEMKAKHRGFYISEKLLAIWGDKSVRIHKIQS